MNPLFHRNSKVVMKIEMPTPLITSVAFCGPNLDTLCVTSGAQEFSFDTAAPVGDKFSDPAGALFVVTGLGAKGMPNFALDKSIASCAKSKC